jgi:hypothetical protein
MVSCTYGLLPNPAKVQISNLGHDGNLSIRNFILMVNKLKNPNFEPLSSIGPYWPYRPKSQISNVGHDGTLSIRNFLLMLELKSPNFEAFGSQWIIGPYNGSLVHSSHHPASGKSPKFLTKSTIVSNRNFILKMKKPKNLGFEPVHP